MDCWPRAVLEIKKTSGTALGPSSSRQAVYRDGVGVIAQRGIEAGKEVMGASWPEHCGSAPGLLKVPEAALAETIIPDHLLLDLRRRFYSEPGWQAVPVNLLAYQFMSQQQYLNEAQTAEYANTEYCSKTDEYRVLRKLDKGEELLVAPGKGRSSKPGASARRASSGDEIKAALHWTLSAPSLRLSQSSIHGVGVVAAASIRIGDVFSLSASQAGESLMYQRQVRVLSVPQKWVTEDLTVQEARYLRDHFSFDDTKEQMVPMVGGFNRLTMAQFINHAPTRVFETIYRSIQYDSTPKTYDVPLIRVIKDFSPGDEITRDFTEGMPMYYKIMILGDYNPGWMKKNIDQCCLVGCDKPGMYSCSKCSHCRYCSKECQMTHWKSRHRKMCRLLRSLGECSCSAGANATPEANYVHENDEQPRRQCKIHWRLDDGE